MLKCPAVDINSSEKYKDKFGLRGKFNSILEERLLDGKDDQHFIMSIEVDPSRFDHWGNLSTHGTNIFWNEVDRAMEKFDKDKIKLKPRNTFVSANMDQKDGNGKRLPFPPNRGHHQGIRRNCHDDRSINRSWSHSRHRHY